MRWLGLMLGVMAVLLAGGRPAPARAATEDDLRAAILRRDDLSEGFRPNEDGPIDDIEFTNYRVSFMREGLGFQVVSAILIDYSSYTEILPVVAGAVTEGVVNAITRGGTLTSTPAEPPSLGADTARYRLAGTTPQGFRLSGEVLGWRQGVIVAVVVVFGVGEPEALPLARRQQERLLAEFGPRTGRAAVPTQIGRVDCAAFTVQEAAQALFDAWEGDPYGLDPDADGIACNALPRRAGSVPGPAAPLLDARGAGNGETDRIAIRGRVEICWEVTGRSEDGAAAIATFLLTGRGLTTPAASLTGRTATGCTFATAAPGAYWITVVAPAYANWRVTITAK